VPGDAAEARAPGGARATGPALALALVTSAQWRRRAATRFVVAMQRQQENTAQDTPTILLEDAEKCHVRLMARVGAAHAA